MRVWSIRILFAIRALGKEGSWCPARCEGVLPWKGWESGCFRKQGIWIIQGNGLVLRFYYPGAGDYKFICMTMCDLLSIVSNVWLTPLLLRDWKTWTLIAFHVFMISLSLSLCTLFLLAGWNRASGYTIFQHVLSFRCIVSLGWDGGGGGWCLHSMHLHTCLMLRKYIVFGRCQRSLNVH